MNKKSLSSPWPLIEGLSFFSDGLFIGSVKMVEIVMALQLECNEEQIFLLTVFAIQFSI